MTALPAIGTLFNDPFEALRGPVPDDYDDNVGRTCELKSNEARYNSKGERIVCRTGRKRDLNISSDLHPESALVLTRYYDIKGALEYSEMDVWSPHIRKALGEVIGEYNGVDLKARRVTLRDFHMLLFHYERELREYGRKLDDSQAALHIHFALQYLVKTLETEMRSFLIMVKINDAPSIDFDNLWMVFRPGALIYSKQAPRGERVYKLRSIEFRGSIFFNSSWLLRLWSISCDGENFGYESSCVHISAYEGYRLLEELSYSPLEYHPNRNDIEARALSRGGKFISFCGQHHCEYKGMADMMTMTKDFDGDQWPQKIPREV